MNMEDQVREAIVCELKRQGDISERGLKVDGPDEQRLRVEGPIDLDELSMAVVGAVAGGP